MLSLSQIGESYEMTNLQRALEIYDRRSQFHDRGLLEKVIQAVREEEKKKYDRVISLVQKFYNLIQTIKEGD